MAFYLPSSNAEKNFTRMLASKGKLDLLTAGYLRSEITEQNTDDRRFEMNLSMIIAEYLLLKEYFEHYNEKEITSSNENMKIKRAEDGNGFTTACGSIRIPSTSKTKHHWKIKIVQANEIMGIGIIDTKTIEAKEACLTGPDHIKFGLWSDGYKNCGCVDPSNSSDKYCSFSYDVDDVIQLILDLKAGTLVMVINDKEPDESKFDNIVIQEDIDYCIAVTVHTAGDSVELVDYFEETL